MNWRELAVTEFPELAPRSEFIDSRTELYFRLGDLLRGALEASDLPLIDRVLEFASRGLRKTRADEGWWHCSVDLLRPFATSPSLRALLFQHLNATRFEQFLPVFAHILPARELKALEAEYRLMKRPNPSLQRTRRKRRAAEL
jgi:hypothetical protein